MDISDSDDDCQLYTRTAEHFRMKRQDVMAKRRELEEVINLVPDDEVETVLDDKNFIKNPDKVDNLRENGDSFKLYSESYLDNSAVNLFESEDDISLAELSRNLKRNKRRRTKAVPFKTKQTRTKRHSRRQIKNRQPAPPQVRDLGVITLDDDEGYAVGPLPPIDFNSRSKDRSTDEGLKDISLNSILNQDSEDDDSFESDILVTLTIEWHNGQKTTRKEFKLRKYQKFESIFEELAKTEDIPTSRVLLMYNYKSVSPMDSPASLNLKFYGALVGSVSATDINHKKIIVDSESDEESNSKDCIKVKLLLKSKETLLLTIMKHQRMDVLYKKCAEEIKCDSDKLKITFDGDYVEPSDLVSDLDVEDGDVFDVHIKKYEKRLPEATYAVRIKGGGMDEFFHGSCT